MTSSNRPPVVTLCGSMRFFDLMLATAAELTGRGEIVLAPFVVVDAGDQDSTVKAGLDELHRRKIDLADRIVVVTDHTRYHGESTRAEIAYATEHGKPVDWAIHTLSTGTCTTAAATQARGSE